MNPKQEKTLTTVDVAKRQWEKTVASALCKIESDLDYRTPPNNRMLRYVVLEREQGAALLKYVALKEWGATGKPTPDRARDLVVAIARFIEAQPYPPPMMMTALTWIICELMETST